jgi:hypothetical protein
MNEFLGTITPEGVKTEPVNNNCIVCQKPWVKGEAGNVSFIAGNGAMVTYFFRFHKTCWNNLDKNEQWLIESSLVDNLTPTE